LQTNEINIFISVDILMKIYFKTIWFGCFYTLTLKEWNLIIRWNNILWTVYYYNLNNNYSKRNVYLINWLLKLEYIMILDFEQSVNYSYECNGFTIDVFNFTF